MLNPSSSNGLRKYPNHSYPIQMDGAARETKVFEQPAAILDFLWYPTASPWNPPSFCFLASVRECPVKLLDASDGRVSTPLYWLVATE